MNTEAVAHVYLLGVEERGANKAVAPGGENIVYIQTQANKSEHWCSQATIFVCHNSICHPFVW